jgi:hypothetical protein
MGVPRVRIDSALGTGYARSRFAFAFDFVRYQVLASQFGSIATL